MKLKSATDRLTSLTDHDLLLLELLSQLKISLPDDAAHPGYIHFTSQDGSKSKISVWGKKNASFEKVEGAKHILYHVGVAVAKPVC